MGWRAWSRCRAFDRRGAGKEGLRYVSFGPGTGQKDGALLGHWLEAGAEITYYPFDASMPLLTRAIRCVLDEIPEATRDRLYIKAVAADFNHAKTVDMVFRQRSSPNVVAVLGNSLACQDDELALLRLIGDRMTPDDLLVLEAPLWSDGDVRALSDSSAGSAFYFGPLASLGVPFESAKMSVSTTRHLSSIPGTVSTVVSYAEVELEGHLYRDIPLAVTHSYTESDLLRALESICFEIFASRGGNPSGEPLVCVARRRIRH
ncbi:MAG TPA: L-histidine N(alpha)-methyltransferase [Solirubrobacterales bacterium]